MKRALFSIVWLVGCATAQPHPTTPVRAYYVSATAPACVDDDGELGASLAALRFDAESASTSARTMIVRASYDCALRTTTRPMRLSTSEALAENCTAENDPDGCPFVRSCWATLGAADRACGASDQAHASDLFAMLAQEAAPLPGTFERDPAGRADAPTVYVETGTSLYGQGHLVQRVDDAWRVVLSAVVWQR